MASYKHGIVTFLDLLGFGVAVDSGKPVDEILGMLSAVKKAAHEDAETKEMVEIEYMCISDCVIRSMHLEHPTKVTAPDLQYELLRLVHMQCQLIYQGFPVRGAVSHGEVYFSGRTLFGPAYQRAYKLEQKEAKYPRIIVDDSVVTDFVGYPEAGGDTEHGGAMDELMGEIRRDTDGVWFVDYLRSFMGELDSEVEFRGFLKVHQELISERLVSSVTAPTVWEKYEWMRQYHNTVVNELSDEWFKYCAVTRASMLVPEIK